MTKRTALSLALILVGTTILALHSTFGVQPFVQAAPDTTPDFCPVDVAAYWQLDESTSGTYTDAIGEDDGFCANGKNCPAPTSDGRINGAQTFDSSNETGIDVPGSSDATRSFDWGQDADFTIEFWMKGTSEQTCSTGNEAIVSRTYDGSDHHWWMGCRSSTDGKAFFALTSNNGDRLDLNRGDTTPAHGPSINDGDWHHIVGIREADSNVVRLYVDATEIVAGALDFSSGFTDVSPLNLGYLNLAGGSHFEGTLDEVVLYDRALSPDEIQQHYEDGLNDIGVCAGTNSYLPVVSRQ